MFGDKRKRNVEEIMQHFQRIVCIRWMSGDHVLWRLTWDCKAEVTCEAYCWWPNGLNFFGF